MLIHGDIRGHDNVRAEPVDAGGAEPIGECVDGLDEQACDVPPRHCLAT